MTTRFGPANQVTLARAVLVTMVAILAVGPPSPVVASTAVALSLVVTLLDGVDGWLARRTRTVSAVGARFDMEVDAALILALAILAWRYGKAGAWVLASGLLRYGFLATGWLWRAMARPLPPSRRRQTICVVQVVSLIVVMVPAVQPPQSTLVAAAALAALGCSFLADTVWLARTARYTDDSR